MDVRLHLPLEELVRLERVEKDAAQSNWLRIAILAIGGWTAPSIAMSVGLTRRVCQRWVYRYNEFGFDGLNDRRGQLPKPTLTPEQEVQVRERLEAGPKPKDQVCSLRGVDVPRILAEEFDVLRSLAAVYYLLHQLGYSYLSPRPTAVGQTEYKYLWVLGAVCPETGHSDGLLSPQLNTKIVNIFLPQFSQTPAADEHAAVIWDGAGFHTSDELKVPANVTLIRLPAYSP